MATFEFECIFGGTDSKVCGGVTNASGNTIHLVNPEWLYNSDNSFTVVSPTFPCDIPDGDTQLITIQLDPQTEPESYPGTFSSRFRCTIRYSPESGAPDYVRDYDVLNATVTDPGWQPTDPWVTLTPTSLDFGHIDAETYSDLTFTIHNESPYLIYFDTWNFDYETEFYIMGDTPAWVSSDSTTGNITVRFYTSGAGDFNDTLTINMSSDFGTPIPATLTMTGSGDSTGGTSGYLGPRAVYFGNTNNSPTYGGEGPYESYSGVQALLGGEYMNGHKIYMWLNWDGMNGEYFGVYVYPTPHGLASITGITAIFDCSNLDEGSPATITAEGTGATHLCSATWPDFETASMSFNIVESSWTVPNMHKDGLNYNWENHDITGEYSDVETFFRNTGGRVAICNWRLLVEYTGDALPPTLTDTYVDSVVGYAPMTVWFDLRPYASSGPALSGLNGLTNNPWQIVGGGVSIFSYEGLIRVEFYSPGTYNVLCKVNNWVGSASVEKTIRVLGYGGYDSEGVGISPNEDYSVDMLWGKSGYLNDTLPYYAHVSPKGEWGTRSLDDISTGNNNDDLRSVCKGLHVATIVGANGNAGIVKTSYPPYSSFGSGYVNGTPQETWEFNGVDYKTDEGFAVGSEAGPGATLPLIASTSSGASFTKESDEEFPTKGGIFFLKDVSTIVPTFPTGLLNTGFEDWTSDTNAENWTEDLSGSGTIEKESVKVADGNYAAKITTTNGSSVWAVLSQAVILAKGYSYIFSLKLASSVALTSPRTFLWMCDTDTGTLQLQENGTFSSSEYNFWGDTLAVTTDYQTFTVIITPTVTQSYTINLSTSDNSTPHSIYVDTISLVGSGDFKKMSIVPSGTETDVVATGSSFKVGSWVCDATDIDEGNTLYVGKLFISLYMKAEYVSTPPTLVISLMKYAMDGTPTELISFVAEDSEGVSISVLSGSETVKYDIEYDLDPGTTFDTGERFGIVVWCGTSEATTLTLTTQGTEKASYIATTIGTTGKLNAVKCISSGNAWAVGNAGWALVTSEVDKIRGCAFHWDGTVWEPIGIPIDLTYVSFCDCSFVNANLGWFLGNYDDGNSFYPVLVKYDSGTWSLESLTQPVLPGGGTHIAYKIRMTTSNEGWLMSYAGATDYTYIIYHYSYGGWNIVETGISPRPLSSYQVSASQAMDFYSREFGAMVFQVNTGVWTNKMNTINHTRFADVYQPYPGMGSGEIIKDVKVIDRNNILACGMYGKIYRMLTDEEDDDPGCMYTQCYGVGGYTGYTGFSGYSGSSGGSGFHKI